MREKGRERSSASFNAMELGRGDDFRNKLVSVHVDNLNPVLDQVGLWGIFKPFGRVRDVYLSPRNNARGSLFAFIRFETMEEATKVARLTNGMHVYGWPIVSKVATYGWSERRHTQGGRQQHYQETSLVRRGNAAPMMGNRSFVEIVKDNKGLKEDIGGKGDGQRETEHSRTKEVSMFWNSHQREDFWLSKCAVGTLKSFSNVECVNERLNNRGFNFTSHFLGTKSVLWRFDSELDKEGFINNRFFWDDRFVAMRNWSDSPPSNVRMAWFKCTGIPLSYWSSDFFVKLGWVIGEPLLVDEDTATRRRLDSGRILILVCKEETVSTKVRVEVGKGSFVVTVKEETEEVDGLWVEKHLGLKKEVSAVHGWCEEEAWETDGKKEGQACQDSAVDFETQRGVRGWFKNGQNKGGIDGGRKKIEQSAINLSGKGINNQSAAFRRSSQNKGKMKWVPIPRRSAQKKECGRLVIREFQGQSEKGRESDSTSSSEEEGLISEFKKWKGERGECSKPGMTWKKERASGNEPNGLGNSSFSRSASLDGPLLEFLEKVDRRGGLASTEEEFGQKEGPIYKSQSLNGTLHEYLDKLEYAFIKANLTKSKPTHRAQNLVKVVNHNQDSSVEEHNGVGSESFVKETKGSIDRAKSEDELGMEGASFDSVSATKEMEEIQSDFTMKSQMRNQAINRVNHNQQQRKTRFDENRGVETATNGSWNEEDEVAMVMDMGFQLGIDFKGKESEVAEFIRKREREIIDRFGRDGGH